MKWHTIGRRTALTSVSTVGTYNSPPWEGGVGGVGSGLGQCLSRCKRVADTLGYLRNDQIATVEGRKP